MMINTISSSNKGNTDLTLLDLLLSLLNKGVSLLNMSEITIGVIKDKAYRQMSAADLHLHTHQNRLTDAGSPT